MTDKSIELVDSSLMVVFSKSCNCSNDELARTTMKPKCLGAKILITSDENAKLTWFLLLNAR